MKNEMTVEINADTSTIKEQLAEIEQTVDRIAEKVSRLKDSLADVAQTADASDT